MKVVEKIIKNGKGHIRPSEPLQLYSLWFISNDKNSYLNSSVHNLKVHGLSKLKLVDVSVNPKTMETSVLLRAEALQIQGDYEIGDQYSLNETNFDRGDLRINIEQWSTTLSTRIINESEHSLIIGRKSVKSFFDKTKHVFTSSLTSYTRDESLNNCISSIVPLILRKVREAVDEQMNAIISEVFIEDLETETVLSFQEILEAHSSSRQKRQVPCEKGAELDEYVDSLFRFASRVVRAMEPFGLPNATVDLPEYNIKLFLHSGGASRAYTLNRRRPAWVHCSNESISLGLTIGFEELRVKYKYRAIHDWNLLFDGELEAMIKDTKLQVQFTQTTPEEDSEEQVQQRVDRVRIWRLGHIRIIIRGLGNISHTLSMFMTNFVNQNQDQLEPTIRTLEKEGVAFANVMLRNISIPFFSII
ncbi:hypothetical protein B4U80_01929 [Leptotrombidium deliense]|uniref:Uncharacterized protein n=1 Tax=Leptotrombidium deliense TaxID=299467 RepID=A0A443SW17_9ACAR|nr:hypothetical protein B4U80_01929 [Leptotrombidium deliense]